MVSLEFLKPKSNKDAKRAFKCILCLILCHRQHSENGIYALFRNQNKPKWNICTPLSYAHKTTENPCDRFAHSTHSTRSMHLLRFRNPRDGNYFSMSLVRAFLNLRIFFTCEELALSTSTCQHAQAESPFRNSERKYCTDLTVQFKVARADVRCTEKDKTLD